VATLEMNMKADYANADSLKKIVREIKKNSKQVTDVAYQEDLTERVNNNLQRVSVVLLVLAVLLIIVSYSLISNYVRLDIYSRRFSIHTMKLVGASWSFIRWPFLRRSISIGLVASLLACASLCGIVYGLYQYQPGAQEIITWIELTIMGLAVFAFGFLIMLFCTFISVNKFLRMTSGELYKL
jgi:cell division transport system permease protein